MSAAQIEAIFPDLKAAAYRITAGRHRTTIALPGLERIVGGGGNDKLNRRPQRKQREDNLGFLCFLLFIVLLWKWSCGDSPQEIHPCQIHNFVAATA